MTRITRQTLTDMLYHYADEKARFEGGCEIDDSIHKVNFKIQELTILARRTMSDSEIAGIMERARIDFFEELAGI